MVRLRRSGARRTGAAAVLRSGAYLTGSAFALAAAVTDTARAADGDPLEEVTVTATRQTETVEQVPLSIQAVTQDNLDRQGIKNIRRPRPRRSGP